MALIFFAGHGMEIAGDNRLLPVDADPTSLESLLATSLPLDELRRRRGAGGAGGADPGRCLPRGPVRRGRRAPGTRSGVALSPRVKAEVNPGMGRMGAAENTLFAFATAPGAVALDGSGADTPVHRGAGALSRHARGSRSARR